MTKIIETSDIKTSSIDVQRTDRTRINEIDFNNIQFGEVFSDHMFVVDFRDGEWVNPKIMPYGNLPMSPATAALHYGQAIFEGMKAYRGENNEVLIFRPIDNFKRLNRSAERMCMPVIPEELFMEALTGLLKIDRQWVPAIAGASLYVRPVMFGTDELIKVKTSEKYRFAIITCPVGKYYLTPVKVKIETKYTRASAGGVGFAKAAGNYGAALGPTKIAQQQGYRQLIWTDSKEHKYIEECGVMNIMFVIGDKLLTPSLDTNTILPGITRDSVLTLARDWGMNVEERRITIDEIIEACKNGTIKDAFGTGTAATIAHIAAIGYNGKDHILPPAENREFSNKVYEELEGIKRGKKQDLHDWVYRIE